MEWAIWVAVGLTTALFAWMAWDVVWLYRLSRRQMQAMARGDTDTAMDCVRALGTTRRPALRLLFRLFGPGTREAQLAHLHFVEGNLDDALVAAEKAWSMARPGVNGWDTAGAILTETLTELGQYDRAHDVAAQLRAHPALTTRLAAMGARNAICAMRLDEGLAIVRQARARDPLHVIARVLESEVLALEGHHEAALAVLSMDPSSPELDTTGVVAGKASVQENADVQRGQDMALLALERARQLVRLDRADEAEAALHGLTPPPHLAMPVRSMRLLVAAAQGRAVDEDDYLQHVQNAARLHRCGGWLTLAEARALRGDGAGALAALDQVPALHPLDHQRLKALRRRLETGPSSAAPGPPGHPDSPGS